MINKKTLEDQCFSLVSSIESLTKTLMSLPYQEEFKGHHCLINTALELMSLHYISLDSLVNELFRGMEAHAKKQGETIQ